MGNPIYNVPHAIPYTRRYMQYAIQYAIQYNVCIYVCLYTPYKLTYIQQIYKQLYDQSGLDSMDGGVGAVFWKWGDLQALQMEAVTLVLIASLVAHLYFWPYEATWPELIAFSLMQQHRMASRGPCACVPILPF